MNPPQAPPPWARALLESAPHAHLGLLDEQGRPRVQPVTFAFLEGLAWSAVDGKPKRVAPSRLARVRRLRSDPRAALTVDHYEADWSRLAWVQLLGRVTVHDTVADAGAAGQRALARLAQKYPVYAERPPDGPLLALAPERILCWRAAAGEEAGPGRDGEAGPGDSPPDRAGTPTT
jgi:PPOX class probable F420-dependent enzyme